MAENAKHSSVDATEKQVVTKMQIALSAELYARAMRICQSRNCTLEEVVEGLIDRFLPATGADDIKPTDASKVRAPAAPTPDERWLRRAQKRNRTGW